MSIISSYAQNEDLLHCSAQETSDKDAFRKQIEENQIRIRDYLKQAPLHSRNSGYIPLVFHIVLEEGRDSISQNEILYQIEVLNECFNRQNIDLGRLDPQFREFVNYTGPRFCLGSRFNNGETEIGILFKYTSTQAIGDAVNIEGKNIIKYESLGGWDAWDPDKYVNIWIGDLQFAQGKATFPGTGIQAERGIVIDPDYFGIADSGSDKAPFHLGKTLVHEMGHYFNLLHPWGMEESCDNDDGIEDTPLQEIIYRGCPSGRQITCGSADMYMNFMNFTNDPCLVHFTDGQMAHMVAAIELFYPDLESYDRCYSPGISSDFLDSVFIKYDLPSKRLSLEYPNPIDGTLSVQIYQMDGKKILTRTLYRESFEEIDLNQLPAGIYILFLQSNNNFKSLKLVVN